MVLCTRGSTPPRGESTSKSATFQTEFGKPDAPECPRVYEIQNKSAENPDEDRTPAVVLQWTAPSTNGTPIKRYQVQFQETLLPGGDRTKSTEPNSRFWSFIRREKEVQGKVYRAGESRPLWNQRVPSPKPLEGSRAEKKDERVKKQEKPISSEGDAMDECKVYTGQWTTVYCNKIPKLKLLAPSPNALEWKFRVRAENDEGWSDFSQVLYMHAHSFPSLFKASYPAEYNHVYLSTPNALMSRERK